MFFSGIQDFERNFKTLDRLNALVFNVWRDKSAMAYRDGDIARITNEYRQYISRVRSLAQEAERLYKELDNKMSQIRQLNNEISNLSLNPDIKDCAIWEVRGYEIVPGRPEEGVPPSDQYCGSTKFVAKGLNGATSDQQKAVAARYMSGCDKYQVSLDRNL
jgi:hypothetical protein